MSTQFRKIIASALAEVAADKPMPDAIVWMPAGEHTISAGTADGGNFTGKIICDEEAARVISAEFSKRIARKGATFLDFGHKEDEASAWVQGFSWDPARGIMAHVAWTGDGEKKVRDRTYKSFSPAFAADRNGRVAGFLDDSEALGGLVNAPAFKAMPNLIAARASGGIETQPAPGGSPEHKTNMKDTLIKMLAALKITPPADATDDVLIDLYAKHSTEPAAKVAEEVTKLRASLKESEDNRAKDIKAAAEKAEAFQKELAEIKAAQAAVTARVITSSTPDIVDVVGAYAAKDPCHIKAHISNAQPRAELARERARIFARDIKPFITKNGLHELMLMCSQKEENIVKVVAKQGRVGIQAANSLGTLSGSLIAQTSLSLLTAKLPALRVFTTDFSMENAKLNQSIITRIRGIPTVQSYSTTAGYAASAVTDTDVSVTITDHRYVQFAYNANELASTNRDLFAEQAEGSLYALGKDFVDSAIALFTLANYDHATTGSANGGHSVVTQANWDRSALIDQRAILVGRHVYPDRDKGFTIQTPGYNGNLMKDTVLVANAQLVGHADITLSGSLPPMFDILPIEYADLATANSTANLGAIVATAGSAVIASRLPYDYVDAQIGSNYGAVSQVTDADSGLSVMLTQYVNHDLGVSNYRVAILKGQAVGDTTRAQIITSA